MGGGQSESVHFFPPPWETALVHSHRSRQQTPPYRPWAPCGCTRAALMSMSHRAGGTCLGTPSPDPSSPPSVSFVLPRLPGSPGTTPGALSNTGTTGQDGREDAVQCLWGCACNKEKRSWNAGLQKRGQRLGETVVSEIPPDVPSAECSFLLPFGSFQSHSDVFNSQSHMYL